MATHLVFFFFETSGTEVEPPPADASIDGQYLGPAVFGFFDGYTEAEPPEPPAVPKRVPYMLMEANSVGRVGM